MLRGIAAILLVQGVGAAAAATQPVSGSTNFGVRSLPGATLLTPIVREQADAVAYRPLGAAAGGRTVLAAAAAVASRWGQVTSTWRSPDHNRAVGGVPNSFHLRGRAIDVARQPGVSHGRIAAAYQAAGYRLVESLDEGDHSHFAFALGAPADRSFVQQASATQGEVTRWRMVFAPPSR